MNTIGSRIKQAREQADITQEQLGKLCNTTKQTIFKYETGKVTNIPMDRIVAMAHFLRVDPCYIMGWEESECPRTSHRSIQSENTLSQEESDLLHKYRALDDSGRGRVRNVLEYEYNALPGSEVNSLPKEA